MSFRYDGFEIATQAHVDINRIVNDPEYRRQRTGILDKYDMKIGAHSAHLMGQCVGDNGDSRLDNFAHSGVKGNPEGIRELNQMGYEGSLCMKWEESGMERMAGAAEACEFVKKINFEPSVVWFDEAMKRKFLIAVSNTSL